MHATDEQLMLRVKQGDVPAFEELFARYRHKLYNYILRFIGDPGVTEDIFQETFLRVYKYSPRYEPLARFTTFLYRIATNLCINEKIRRSKVSFFQFGGKNRAQEDDRDQLEDCISDARPGQDSVLFSRELNDYFQLALREVPADMKAALLLSEIEGKKYEEIAEILDCSIGTVKSRINRARTKFIRYFKDHGIL
jgi:RNA polymerase sigma-70 factor, ECF subfamily